MNTGQCHPKTIRSQYHHSQALQLTVDSFWKRFFMGLLRKKSLGEILFKMLPTARNILGR